MKTFLKRKKWITALLLCMMAVWAAPSVFAAEPPTGASSIQYDGTTLLVKLRAGGTELFSLQEPLPGVMELEYLFSNYNLYLRHAPEPDQGDWYVARLSAGTEPEEARRELLKRDDVLAVEWNSLLELFDDGLPDQQDPDVGRQWYLDSCGIAEARQYLEQNFGAPGGRSDLVVAVLDTGVAYNHVDLTSNIWENAGEIEGNGVDDDGNGYIDDVHGWNFADGSKTGNNDINDTNGHGTRCAGIIAAARNGTGTEGVAYGVKIMPVKVVGTTSTVSNLVKGINYACANGADVVNMSLGITNSNSQALREAIDQYSDNVLFVAAAGNSESRYEGYGNSGWPTVPVDGAVSAGVTYPAAYPNVLGVMSCNAASAGEGSHAGDWKSSFSRWDPVPVDGVDYELIAPGNEIYSTTFNGYGSDSGTSFSAPFVSGCAALLLTKYKGRDDFSMEDLRQILSETADEIQGWTVTYQDPDTWEELRDVYYFRRINIAKALEYRREAATLYRQCRFSNGQLQQLMPLVHYGSTASKLQFTYESLTKGILNGPPTEDGQYLVTAGLEGQESLYYRIVNPQVSLTLTSTPGDYNGDNLVDGSDVGEFAYYMYAQEQTDGRYCALADLDGDGVVGTKDLILLSRKLQ